MCMFCYFCSKNDVFEPFRLNRIKEKYASLDRFHYVLLIFISVFFCYFFSGTFLVNCVLFFATLHPSWNPEVPKRGMTTQSQDTESRRGEAKRKAKLDQSGSA